jgi:hypothetical protein
LYYRIQCYIFSIILFPVFSLAFRDISGCAKIFGRDRGKFNRLYPNESLSSGSSSEEWRKNYDFGYNSNKFLIGEYPYKIINQKLYWTKFNWTKTSNRPKFNQIKFKRTRIKTLTSFLFTTIFSTMTFFSIYFYDILSLCSILFCPSYHKKQLPKNTATKNYDNYSV